MSCTVAISSSPGFSPSSPSSPLRIRRLPKPPSPLSPSGLIVASSSLESSSSSTSPCVLKRKRPGKLEIPLVSMSFGNFPASPFAAEVRRRDVVVEEEGDGYVVCCKKGRREAMEDRFSAVSNLQGNSKLACFGVFDGHGGAKAAAFAADNLCKNIVYEMESREDNDIEEAVKIGYLKTDSDFLKQDLRGGSCSVTALIRKGNLVVSNAGDCRAVLSRGGVAEALTSDHRPSRDDEKDRIEAQGGYVCCCNGVWRIHGSLAVSRGIGDQYLKPWVIAEPETRVLRLQPELEFLILASDGLWDKVSNQEAIDIARPLCNGVDDPQPLTACRKLIDLSVSRGSADDISVMLVELGRFQ